MPATARLYPQPAPIKDAGSSVERCLLHWVQILQTKLPDHPNMPKVHQTAPRSKVYSQRKMHTEYGSNIINGSRENLQSTWWPQDALMDQKVTKVKSLLSKEEVF